MPSQSTCHCVAASLGRAAGRRRTQRQASGVQIGEGVSQRQTGGPTRLMGLTQPRFEGFEPVEPGFALALGGDKAAQDAKANFFRQSEQRASVQPALAGALAQGRVGRRLQSGFGAAKAAGEAGEALRRAALAGESRRDVAQTRAGEAGGVVRGILRESQSPRGDVGEQARLGKVEKGTGDLDAFTMGARGHPRQPCRRGAAKETKKDRLDLIVGVVRRHDDSRARLARGARQQSVARGAGAFLKSGAGLGVLPPQNAGGKPQGIALRERGAGFRVRALAQGVVDDRSGQR